jgi:hypothetical protein
MNARIKRFADWFRSQSDRLLAVPSQAVADELIEHLAHIDERLGVEVEREKSSDARELVLTASSDPLVFPTVHAIVRALGEVSGWKFCGLKQPKGFNFSITLSGQKLRADNLRFRPISEIPNGFEILAPGLSVCGDGAEEAAWLVVETGIGEESTGRVSHLEFGDSADLTGSKPIIELATLLQ